MKAVAYLATSGLLAACAASMSAQPAAGTIPLQPAPAIAGVITAGTRPQLIATGLNGADDPIWIPDIGLLFSEPNADRIVRLSDTDTLLPFVAGLHRPLGMTGGQERTEAEYGVLLGKAGFRLNRVVPTASAVSVVEAFAV